MRMDLLKCCQSCAAISAISSKGEVMDENMLCTPAPHSLLHVLIHFVTDVHWK